jgi:hypothetical protein
MMRSCMITRRQPPSACQIRHKQLAVTIKHRLLEAYVAGSSSRTVPRYRMGGGWLLSTRSSSLLRRCFYGIVRSIKFLDGTVLPSWCHDTQLQSVVSFVCVILSSGSASQKSAEALLG